MHDQVLEVTVAWGPTILDVLHLAAGESFRLDDDSPYGGVESVVPEGSALTLARVSDEGPRVWLPAGVPGAIQVDEAITDLPGEQAQTLLVGPEGRIRADVGALTLYFAQVQRAAHPGGRKWGGVLGDTRSLGAAAVLHALVVLVAIAMPPQSEAFSLDELDSNDRFVEVLLKPSDPKPEDLFTAQRGQEQGGDGAQAPEPVSDDPPSGSQEAPDDRPPVPTVDRETRIKIAQAAAGSLANALEQELDMMGGSDLLGQQARSALGGLNGGDGGKALAMNGGDGLGPAGRPGGPGFGPGKSLRAGPIRTGPRRPGFTPGIPGRDTRKPKRPKVVALAPQVAEGLKRDEIQRVVRAHHGQYRACYEKALQTRRDLEGKIRVEFVVGPTGKVIKAIVLDSTIGDPGVGACITRRIRNWQFPRPRGGGVVAVKYPFLFRRS